MNSYEALKELLSNILAGEFESTSFNRGYRAALQDVQMAMNNLSVLDK